MPFTVEVCENRVWTALEGYEECTTLYAVLEQLMKDWLARRVWLHGTFRFLTAYDENEDELNDDCELGDREIEMAGMAVLALCLNRDDLIRKYLREVRRAVRVKDSSAPAAVAPDVPVAGAGAETHDAAEKRIDSVMRGYLATIDAETTVEAQERWALAMIRFMFTEPFMRTFLDKNREFKSIVGDKIVDLIILSETLSDTRAVCGEALHRFWWS